jgi:CPA2 family monovalent cation:H+ antiporter-2
VQAARRENPDLHIIVRTRYVAEVDDLKKLGANEVIPEEFETSIEIFSRVLDYFSLPRNVINDYIDAVRSDNYGVLRRMDLPRKHLAERLDVMEGIDTESYLIKEGSEITGQTIKDTRLRAETGVTVVAVQRDGKIHQNPSPDFTLKTGDILVLIGKRDQINRAREYLETVSFPEKK